VTRAGAPVTAPFTAEQVTSLAGFQLSLFHPYTCCNGHGSLTPTEAGLVCKRCDYTQGWVHDWTADGTWIHLEVGGLRWALYGYEGE
jgi:hypothetical protein